MALGKQAKPLTEAQQAAVLERLKSTRHADRDRVMFLLRVDAALRAKEIALLEWPMVTDASGKVTDCIRLQDKAAKGKSGGVVYMSKRLIAALEALQAEQHRPGRV